MQIPLYTTATTAADDWSGLDILVDESYYSTFMLSQDHDLTEQLRVYQQGLDQGLITVIG